MRYRLLLMFLLLFGLVASLEAASKLDKKRAKIKADDLSYIHDANLDYFIRHALIVPIASTPHMKVADDLDDDARYVRPWVLPLLTQFADEYYKKWKEPIHLNSALRTVEHHEWLRGSGTTKNAARGLSPHSTGATVDISHLGLSKKKRSWVTDWWRPHVKRGEVIFTTEHASACWDLFFRRPHSRSSAKAAAAKAKTPQKKPRPTRKTRARLLFTF